MNSSLESAILSDLTELYGPDVAPSVFSAVTELAVSHRSSILPSAQQKRLQSTSFTQRDAVMIAYPDHMTDDSRRLTPLQQLHEWCTQHVQGVISMIHVLPFHPSTGYDGYSISNYATVDPAHGTWENVDAFPSSGFRLMTDIVLNHCSPEHPWFKQLLRDEAPGKDYFITAHTHDEPWLSQVKRARNLPLIYDRTVTRASGEKITVPVWATYHRELVDLNWRNPQVFIEFLKLMLGLSRRSFFAIRLDAFAYVWKEKGTCCNNLPQTQVLLHLFRCCLDLSGAAHTVFLPSITNTTQQCNFTNLLHGAHFVYHLPLSALLLHTLYSGNACAISRWINNLDVPPPGRGLLNLASSHDGVGLTWCRGLISEADTNALVEGTTKRGGIFVSRYETPESKQPIPWEICITYWSACSPDTTTTPKNDDFAVARATRYLHVKRFLATQSVVIALRGVPSLYFGLWMCSENDYARVEGLKSLSEADRNLCCIERAINRGRFTKQEWDRRLSLRSHPQAASLRGMKILLRVRSTREAFHPDGAQRTIYLSQYKSLFALERVPPNGNFDQAVVCLVNFGDAELYVSPTDALTICENIATAKNSPQRCGICSNLLKSLPHSEADEMDSMVFAPVDLRFGLLMKPYEVMWLTAGWADSDPRALSYQHVHFPKAMKKMAQVARSAGFNDAANMLEKIRMQVTGAKMHVPVGSGEAEHEAVSRTAEVEKLLPPLDFDALEDSFVALQADEDGQALRRWLEENSGQIHEVSAVKVLFVHHGESTQKLYREHLKRQSGNRQLCYCFDTTIDNSPAKQFQILWLRNEIGASTKENPCPYFCDGIVDAQLTEKGFIEKLSMRKYVRESDLSAILCSPDCRALQTSYACSDNLPINVMNDLCPMRSSHMHSCRSQLSVLRKLFPRAGFDPESAENDIDFDAVVPGQEDRLTVDSRGFRFLLRLFQNFGTNPSTSVLANVLVVTHFTFLFSLILKGNDPRVFGARPSANAGSILNIDHCPSLLAIRENPSELTNCCVPLVLLRVRYRERRMRVPSPRDGVIMQSSQVTINQKLSSLLLRDGKASTDDLRWMFVAAAAANDRAVALVNPPDAQFFGLGCQLSVPYGPLFAVVGALAMRLFDDRKRNKTLRQTAWGMLPAASGCTTSAVIACMLAGVTYVAVPQTFRLDFLPALQEKYGAPLAIFCSTAAAAEGMKQFIPPGADTICFESFTGKLSNAADVERFYAELSEIAPCEQREVAFVTTCSKYCGASPIIDECTIDDLQKSLTWMRNQPNGAALHVFSRILATGNPKSRGKQMWLETVGALLYGGCVVHGRECTSELMSGTASLIQNITEFECSVVILNPIEIPPLLPLLTHIVETRGKRGFQGLRESRGPWNSPFPSLRTLVIEPGLTRLSSKFIIDQPLKALEELLPGITIIMSPYYNPWLHLKHIQNDEPIFTSNEALEYIADELHCLPQNSTLEDLHNAMSRKNRLDSVTRICTAFTHTVPFHTIWLTSMDKSIRGIPSKECIVRSVLGRLGGTCHVLNIFMQELLHACGLSAHFARASIHGAIDMHITIILTSFLEDDDAWLLDVATGNRNILRPVCLSFSGIESEVVSMGTWKVKFVRYSPETNEESATAKGIRRIHCDNPEESKFDHVFWTMSSLGPTPAYDSLTSPYVQCYLTYEKLRAATTAYLPDGSVGWRYFRADPRNGAIVAKAISQNIEKREERTLVLSLEELFEELCVAFPVLPRSSIAQSLVRISAAASSTK